MHYILNIRNFFGLSEIIVIIFRSFEISLVQSDEIVFSFS